MGNTKNILGVALVASMLGACSENGETPETTVGFRSAPTGGAPDGYAGNGDIEIHEGDDDDIEDEIIWDILGGTVSRQVEPGVFEECMSFDGEEIQESDEPWWLAESCQLQLDDHPSGEVFHMLDDQGAVVFTLWDRYAFVGEVELPPVPDVPGDAALAAQVALSFSGSHVHSGAWWDGPVLATANADIDQADPERRMLIAALVAGECGSESVP